MTPAHVHLARPVLLSARGVVSCSSPDAVSAGVQMLRAGGNAVDAMVAAALALAVVQPHACGLGGDAMILVSGQEQTIAINGNGQAPAGIISPIPSDGGGTVAVPGFVSGLLAAHTRLGRLPREQLFEPAIELAATGFAVGEDLFSALERQRARLTRTSATWPLIAPRIRIGSVITLPALAEALHTIAERGPRGFYSGPMAAAIANAVRADGGAMTTDDLAQYAAIVRAPVATVFAGALVEVSPPTSQAILLLIALNRLAQRDHHDAALVERARLQMEAVEAAFAHRSEIALAGSEAQLLAPSTSLEEPLETAGHRPRGYNHTAAIAVADADGQVISTLVSVFDDFGSATLVPEFGFHLNSRLLGFDDEGPNAPAPRRRPVHTLSPAIVTTRERLIGIATPGADGQVQILLQVLARVLEDSMPIQLSLDEARWRLVDDEVLVEEGFSRAVVEALERDGRSFRAVPAGDPLFGAVSAVVAPAAEAALEAMSDPRRESWAGVA